MIKNPKHLFMHYVVIRQHMYADIMKSTNIFVRPFWGGLGYYKRRVLLNVLTLFLHI